MRFNHEVEGGKRTDLSSRYGGVLEKMTSARAKAGGLKRCKEANMADAERMEEKSSRRWSQSQGRTGRATEAIIRT